MAAPNNLRYGKWKIKMATQSSSSSSAEQPQQRWTALLYSCYHHHKKFTLFSSHHTHIVHTSSSFLTKINSQIDLPSCGLWWHQIVPVCLELNSIIIIKCECFCVCVFACASFYLYFKAFTHSTNVAHNYRTSHHQVEQKYFSVACYFSVLFSLCCVSSCVCCWLATPPPFVRNFVDKGLVKDILGHHHHRAQ